MAWQAALLLAALQPLPDSAFLTFGRAPAFEPEAIEVRVGTLWREGDGPRRHWFERTGTREGAPPAYAWTTSADCPGADAVLARHRSIELPRLDNPRTDGMLIATFDGARYTLETGAFYGAEGRDGRISLQSNVGTSLARWVDEMLAALQGCWSAARPDTAVRPLTSH